MAAASITAAVSGFKPKPNDAARWQLTTQLVGMGFCGPVDQKVVLAERARLARNAEREAWRKIWRGDFK